MTFQGIHFDEVLMTFSQCEGKEEERKAEAKEECQCEAEEEEGGAEAEAKKAFKEEGYEKEVNRFKMRKEVSMMYFEYILVVCDVE